MFKYALKLTGNKSAAKAIVKNCQANYSKNIAWLAKEKERKKQKSNIRKACHNWLYSQMMEIINKKDQTAYPAVTTLKQSLSQNKLS